MKCCFTGYISCDVCVCVREEKIEATHAEQRTAKSTRALSHMNLGTGLSLSLSHS